MPVDQRLQIGSNESGCVRQGVELDDGPGEVPAPTEIECRACGCGHRHSADLAHLVGTHGIAMYNHAGATGIRPDQLGR